MRWQTETTRLLRDEGGRLRDRRAETCEVRPRDRARRREARDELAEECVLLPVGAIPGSGRVADDEQVEPGALAARSDALQRSTSGSTTSSKASLSPCRSRWTQRPRAALGV